MKKKDILQNLKCIRSWIQKLYAETLSSEICFTLLDQLDIWMEENYLFCVIIVDSFETAWNYRYI